MALDLASPPTTTQLPLIADAESSGGRNVWGPQTDSGQAQGDYQITTGTWRDFAPKAGVDLSKYPDPNSAPAELQAQVAKTIPLGRWDPRTLAKLPGGADYAASTLNIGGMGNMDALAADYPKFQAMIGKPDSSWMAPTITALKANLVAQKAELEGINRQADAAYAADRKRASDAYDAASKDDTTPWTQPPPPPETLQAFASAGSIFAAIASAFTRTPAISAMNGMAAAINARRDGNQKAYDEAYKVWQGNTKLAIDRQKMASDRLTQALTMMQTDTAHGFALAKQVMTEHGDQQGLLMLEAGMYKQLDDANAARDRAALQMTMNYELLGGGKGNPMNIAEAQQYRVLIAQGMDPLKAAETVRMAFQPSGGSASADKEKDVKALALAAFKEKHNGQDPGPADDAEMAALTTIQRQRATALSGRNAIMIGRSLTSAADAVSDLKNVVELPITIDTGIFGGRKQGPALAAASKEILANEVTAEDAQAYNTAMAGLERSLGGLATGGLAVSDNVMNQFGKLTIEKGDTNLIKLRKIATMRQNVDNGLDGLLSNPQLGDAQRELIKKLRAQVVEAVPFTVHDVNMVEFGNDPNMTVGQFAKAHGVDSGAGGGGTPPAGHPDARWSAKYNAWLIPGAEKNQWVPVK